MNGGVDTHCHLDLEQFKPDLEAVLDRARLAGVMATVLIGFNPDRWRTTSMLCDSYPTMVRAIGLHPNDADRWGPELETDLKLELQQPGVVAQGEIGLDYYRDSADKDIQRHVFREQLRIANNLDMPVIIHQRSAEAEVLELIRKEPGVRGVMHCFNGDRSYAEACLDLGFLLGVGGILTFRSAGATRDAIGATPLERIVVETDAPYLAPQAWRGQRNEPAYIQQVVSTIAGVKGIDEHVVATETTRNAIELFGPALAEIVDQEAPTE